MSDKEAQAIAAFTLSAQLADDGVTEAAKILSDVWKNEESRFNNLNTRAVAVLSASSLVTAFLSFFSKNITSSLAKDGTYVALGLLVVTAVLIVFGVLMPKKRPLFGNNWLTDATKALPIPNPDQVAVDRLAATEYGETFVALQVRNSSKANWLKFAYFTFFGAIAASAVATAAFAHG